MSNSTSHFIFYHDSALLDRVVDRSLPQYIVPINLNSIDIPDYLRIPEMSLEDNRAVFSEYLGILTLKPETKFTGLYTYSLPLKFCADYANSTGLYDYFLPDFKFSYLIGAQFHEGKLYGLEFSNYRNRTTGNDVISSFIKESGLSITPKDEDSYGPYKASLIVETTEFLKFQIWFKSATQYLLSKYGHTCGVAPSKINNKDKYWADSKQLSVDLRIRRGIGIIQERLMALYFGRYYSRKNWIDLRFHLNSTQKPGLSPCKMYFMYTPSHLPLLKDWFVPTLKDRFILKPFRSAQLCPSGLYRKSGWHETVVQKFDYMIKAIKENPGEILIFSDVDIQFFGETEELLRKSLNKYDIAFLRDGDKSKFKSSELEEDSLLDQGALFFQNIIRKLLGKELKSSSRRSSNGIYCSGFFALRASDKILKLCKRAKKIAKRSRIGDQRAFNLAFKHFKNEIKIGLLPEEFYSPGIDRLNNNLWTPAQNLSPSAEIVLHHANWTVGVENKLAQLHHVKKLRKERKIIIVLPYFCAEEVERYLRISAIIRHFLKGSPPVEFLLSARFDCEESSRLFRAYSKIGAVRSFRGSTVGRGIINPDNGFEIEGPSAMFWETMEFIAREYDDDNGFALWLESDMVPLRSDWLSKMMKEWSSKYLIMGYYYDQLEKGSKTASHINGGACYRKDFTNFVPKEDFNIRESWDKQVLRYLVDKKLPYKGINHLIDLRYRSSTLNWEIDPNIVLLHGVKDYSAMKYVEDLYGLSAYNADKEEIKTADSAIGYSSSPIASPSTSLVSSILEIKKKLETSYDSN